MRKNRLTMLGAEPYPSALEHNMLCFWILRLPLVFKAGIPMLVSREHRFLCSLVGSIIMNGAV